MAIFSKSRLFPQPASRHRNDEVNTPIPYKWFPKKLRLTSDFFGLDPNHGHYAHPILYT